MWTEVGLTQPFVRRRGVRYQAGILKLKSWQREIGYCSHSYFGFFEHLTYTNFKRDVAATAGKIGRIGETQKRHGEEFFTRILFTSYTRRRRPL